MNITERRYVAISIKHSEYSQSGLVFWGERTDDKEKRCFSGYSNFARNNGKLCELYALKDFQDHYGNGVIKCDEPVKMTSDLIKRWKNYDTVLVDIDDYIHFVS
ncbi:MAG: hypothetical protein AB9836_07425 [Aminipila sp.]